MRIRLDADECHEAAVAEMLDRLDLHRLEGWVAPDPVVRIRAAAPSSRLTLAEEARLAKRCRSLRVKAVPADYAAFETKIERWIATCVMSRTRNVRRERKDIQVEPPDEWTITDPGVDIPFPDVRDLLRDIEKLIELMRDGGDDDGADELEELLEDALVLLSSLGMAIGAFYIGSKFRAGALVLLWGWSLRDDYEALRRFSRAQRIQEELEGLLKKIVVRVERNRDLVAGAGVDWKVIDEIIDPSVPAQIDDAACGPACAQMVLADRGIVVEQVELAKTARAGWPDETKNKEISVEALTGLLNQYDGGWAGGALSIEGATTKQIVQAATSTGSWIAKVGPAGRHYVVVEGFDAKHVLLKDPWSPGSRYKVTWKTFEGGWTTIGIYRRGTR